MKTNRTNWVIYLGTKQETQEESLAEFALKISRPQSIFCQKLLMFTMTGLMLVRQQTEKMLITGQFRNPTFHLYSSSCFQAVNTSFTYVVQNHLISLEGLKHI